jgi:uncharacterized repeat protein (TIGR03803 family)
MVARLLRVFRASTILLSAAIGFFSPIGAASAHAQTYEIVHALHDPPPASPGPALLQGSDGNIYGTTPGGGDDGKGSIFRLTTAGDFRLLHSFTGDDGTAPSELVELDGNFYGTTATGGTTGAGTVFRADSAGEVTTLHEFDVTDGDAPGALFAASDGKLYGTTAGGGAFGSGTLFRIDTDGNFASIASFDPKLVGFTPNGPLVESAGLLCGTTQDGGPDFAGTVFCATFEGAISTDYNFAGTDGATPLAGLANFDGDLFGTTSSGGDDAAGTAFKTLAGTFDLDTWHSFGGDEGGTPAAPLVLGSVAGENIGIYGTTTLGGSGLAGTVFRMDLDHSVTTVHAFTGLDGASPTSALIQAQDGFLYGGAAAGPFGAGVVFRLTSAIIAVHQIFPTSGPASGGTALDVFGGGFTAATTVTIGGVAGEDVTTLDSAFLQTVSPALSPGTLNDVTVTCPDEAPASASATLPNAFFADFVDVPEDDPFHDYVETIFRDGITGGCGPGSYCPQDAVTRAQMAVFLLKSEHGSSFAPPACAGVFGDVPCPSLFADWIEQLASEGITAGCGVGNYCPDAAVTRAQMSVFLLKAKHGSGYAPPACGGVFGDVACPSLFADWIEQLAAEHITGGCGGGNYCPDGPNTRAQMAVFLVKTFGM